MFGLLMRPHMNAGQDGFRDESSKQSYDLIEAMGVHGVSRVVDRSIAPSAHFLQVLASAQHGCIRVAPRVWPISGPCPPKRVGTDFAVWVSPVGIVFHRMAEGCTGRVMNTAWRYVTVHSGSRPRHGAEGGRRLWLP